MADKGVVTNKRQMEFLIRSKEMELKRIQHGLDEKEFRIITYEEEILKTKEDIEISKSALVKVQQEIDRLRQKLQSGQFEGIVE